jgi:hypothetical protein
MNYDSKTKSLVAKWPYKPGDRMVIGNEVFDVLWVERHPCGFLVYYRPLDSRPNACRNGR